MENRRAAVSADIAYMALFILLFICTSYVVYSESTSFSLAAFCIVFAIMTITHFTNITIGLITNIFVIFVVFTYYLYQLMANGFPIQKEIYFWMMISPLLTVTSHIVFRNVHQMEEENRQLKKRVQHFSIVDDMTKLKNIQAYEMEFPIYEKIAKRYEIGLMLLIWQFRYGDDLKKIIGKNNLEQTVVQISKAMEAVFRTEDVFYILSKEPYVWGSLMLTNGDSGELLKERIRAKLNQLDLTEIFGKNAPKLEIRVAMYYKDTEEETALSMLEKVKSRLQYDV